MDAKTNAIKRRQFLGGSGITGAATLLLSAFADLSAKEPGELASEKFRILSLDGGGARGYLSAAILANVEVYLDRISGKSIPLGRRFDLIAGTSTGGIIALGLATGRTAKEIRGFYEDIIPTVFSDTEKAGFLSRLRNPKYRTSKLATAVDTFFGNATLKDVLTDVCITAVALDSGRPRFHKSDYRATYQARLDEKLADIAIATSAAPTYFPAHDLKHSRHLIDGGVCANNPSMVAVVEAVQFDRESKRGTKPVKNIATEVILLSVGTGEQPSMPYDSEGLATAGLIQWAEHISDVMFQSQSDVAHFQTSFLLGENYLRLNPKLPFAMPLDDATSMEKLRNLSDIERVEEPFFKKIL